MSDAQKPKKVRKEGWIYLLQLRATPGRIKVGFSAKDPVGPRGRVASLTFLLDALGLEVEVYSRQHVDAASIDRAMLNALAPLKVAQSDKSTSREIFDFDFECAKKMLDSAVEAFGTPASWSLWKEQARTTAETSRSTLTDKHALR